MENLINKRARLNLLLETVKSQIDDILELRKKSVYYSIAGLICMVLIIGMEDGKSLGIMAIPLILVVIGVAMLQYINNSNNDFYIGIDSDDIMGGDVSVDIISKALSVAMDKNNELSKRLHMLFYYGIISISVGIMLALVVKISEIQ